jgi:putative lipoprotein (rSAM/lipoprotein system)
MKDLFSLTQLGLRTWQTILAFAGLFFGFSNTVAAQYGVMETTFRINGNVRSQECNIPVKGMKVTLEERYGDDPVNHYGNSALTDEKGNFCINLYNHYFGDRMRFIVKDIDSLENGSFNDTAFIIPSSDADFKRIDEGHWNRDYVYIKPVNIQLPTNGIPPCPEKLIIKDTLQIVEDLVPAISIPEKAEQNESIELIDTQTEMINDTIHPPSIVVYPNPDHGAFVIEVESSFETQAGLYIYDASYRLLNRKKIEIMEGMNSYRVVMSDYVPGNYFLIIRGKNIDFSEKIIHY